MKYFLFFNIASHHILQQMKQCNDVFIDKTRQFVSAFNVLKGVGGVEKQLKFY